MISGNTSMYVCMGLLLPLFCCCFSCCVSRNAVLHLRVLWATSIRNLYPRCISSVVGRAKGGAHCSYLASGHATPKVKHLESTRYMHLHDRVVRSHIIEHSKELLMVLYSYTSIY